MTLKRVKFLQALLHFVGFDERLRLEWISSAEAGKFTRTVKDFTEKIRALGPTPIKAVAPAAGVSDHQRKQRRHCSPSPEKNRRKWLIK